MEDITRLRIGKHPIGIVGLKAALEEAMEHSEGMTEDQVGNLLLETLSRKNYIGSDLRDEYKQAFLREYKKQIGESVEDPVDGEMQIKVLGAGCMRCDRLEREIMAVLAETGIIADLEHVRDLDEIGTYGAVGVPALVINGEVKSVGTVPSRSRLKTLIEQVAKASEK